MFRKMILSCCTVILVSNAAQAGINAELFYAQVNVTGIEEPHGQYGAGCSLLAGIDGEFSWLLRGTYSVYTDEVEKSGALYSFSYTHATYEAGIEYDPMFAFLAEYRLSWRNSVCLGYSVTGADADGESASGSSSDSGIALAVNTGLGFDLNRYLQLFIDIGWHQSFYVGEMKDSDIFGVQLFAGARFSFTGSRNIGEGY